jgi:CHASE2 domain-containing sensor protein
MAGRQPQRGWRGRRWWLLALRALSVGLVAVPALWARLRLNAGQAPRFSSGANPAAAAPPTDGLTRALTFPYIWARSYWLLLWPASLSADWGHGSIPLLNTITDGRNLATAAFFLAAAGAVGWSLRRTDSQSSSAALTATGGELRYAVTATWCGMLWLPFLPASNLLFRVGFVIAERVMYHLRDTQLP